eukprot:8053004-Alexandrium_andersonii.AAC.1
MIARILAAALAAGLAPPTTPGWSRSIRRRWSERWRARFARTAAAWLPPASRSPRASRSACCLLYTSDAADDM